MAVVSSRIQSLISLDPIESFLPPLFPSFGIFLAGDLRWVGSDVIRVTFLKLLSLRMYARRIVRPLNIPSLDFRSAFSARPAIIPLPFPPQLDE